MPTIPNSDDGYLTLEERMAHLGGHERREHADNGQHIWRVTFPKRDAIESDKACKLAFELSQCAWHYRTDRDLIAAPGDTKKSEKFNAISGHARAIISFLNDQDIWNRISAHYPFTPIEPYIPGRCEMLRGLGELESAAKVCKREVERKATRKTKPGNSSMDRLIGSVADVYKKHTGKEPGAANTNGKLGGPFVRFIAEAARHNDFGAPAGETIRAALRKWRDPASPKHVFAALKK